MKNSIQNYEPSETTLFENESEGSTLFVFGNGLDIDLGFPTSYKEFFQSEQFPFVSNDPTCHALGYYVYEKGVLEKWYDLENILAEYGCGVGALRDEDVDGDKDDFCRLKDGLKKYLQTIDFKHPRENSVAANILRAADDQLVPPTVYSFNYTDFEAISKGLSIGYSNVHHIHGSLKNDDVVLGVGEYVKLGSNASYLHKTSSLGYDSGGILNAFERYETIIIFGLSLSQVDYPYFEDFFKDVSSRVYMGDKKKYIRVFTYDEKSRLEVLDNLRGMNSGLIKLRGYSDFDIIRVKNDIDFEKVEEVKQRLSKRWEIDV